MLMRKRNLKGSLTVEASLLMPIILVITIILFYLVIYAYDRALMVQDVAYIAELAVSAEYSHRDSVERAAYNAYKTVKEEHPYLSVRNIELTVSLQGLNLCVSLRGEWVLPIVKGLNKQVCASCRKKLLNPMDVIYLANDLTETIEGVWENNDQ